MYSNTAIRTISSSTPALGLAQRLGQRLLLAWRDWRAQARLNQELRALEALSDATLHDIGLAERVLARPSSTWADYGPARW